MALIGAAIGSLFSGIISDKIGRKPVILIADVLFTIGAAMMAFAPTISFLMVGRVVIGLGVGAAAQIVPLYLAEVAPVEIRGKLIAMNTALITGGQVFSVILVFIIKPDWRVMLGLAGVPSTIQFIGMLFMPESPRWLGKVERTEKMKVIVKKIYKESHKDYAIQTIEEEVENLKAETRMTEMERLRSLFTTYRPCLIIGCSMQAFQQLIGINTAMYYGPDILKEAGITFPGLDDDTSALLLNIPLASINAIGTLISVFIIDRLGRRYILLRTLPFVILGWVVVATGMGIAGNPDNKSTGGMISFVGLIIFLLFFSIGVSSTVNAEIYPIHVIGTASSLSTTTNWATNAVVASVFLLTTSTVVGQVITYSILALFGLLCLIFVYFKVPETANKEIN